MLLILNCDHIIQAIRLLMDSNSYTVNGSISMQPDSSLLPEKFHARVPVHESYPMVSPVLLLENIRSYCYRPIILIKINPYDFQFLSNIGIIHLHRFHKSTTNQE